MPQSYIINKNFSDIGAIVSPYPPYVEASFLGFLIVAPEKLLDKKKHPKLFAALEQDLREIKRILPRLVFVFDKIVPLPHTHGPRKKVELEGLYLAGRRKFRRQKFRRQKFRRKKFRRISKSGNFVVRKFVVGNFVVLIRITAFTKRYHLNYTIT